MKIDDLRLSIVLYGKIETSPLKWWEWYLYAKGLNKTLGRNTHHAGITGDSFPPGCVLKFAEAEKRLTKAVEAGKHFKYLSLYSMPAASTPAGFDHTTYMLRTCYSEPNRILITLLPEDYLKVDVDNVISDLKNLIQFSSGQVFEMSIAESPFSYVMRPDSVSRYKTLQTIKEF